jgi:hypothetical protein
MAKPSKAVLEFMENYGVASDEIWEVHGTTWCVKHKALERVAAQVGIVWEKPELKVCDMEKGLIAILVGGKLGTHTEFSFGEASPKNNKNSYPIAMAEKRAKDRVILKLLAVHGDLYSEEEADDFKRPNPHVNKASDFYDHVSADIPDVPATKMKVKDARPQFDALVKEMRRIQDPAELKEWGAAQAEVINSFPGEWPTMFRGEYTKHKQAISNTMMAG